VPSRRCLDCGNSHGAHPYAVERVVLGCLSGRQPNARQGEYAEVDEGYIGGRTRGKGHGVTDKLLVACAVEVRQLKPGTKLDKRKCGRYAGRVRLAIVSDRSADSLCGFVENAVAAGTSITMDDWSGYASLSKRAY
jgi:hypothetical protein